MALDGNLMASEVVTAIKSVVTLDAGQEAESLAIFQQICGAIVAHIQTNAQVPLGIAVQVTPATGTGATTAPGAVT